jgi:hypothetical protein
MLLDRNRTAEPKLSDHLKLATEREVSNFNYFLRALLILSLQIQGPAYKIEPLPQVLTAFRSSTKMDAQHNNPESLPLLLRIITRHTVV